MTRNGRFYNILWYVVDFYTYRRIPIESDVLCVCVTSSTSSTYDEENEQPNERNVNVRWRKAFNLLPYEVVWNAEQILQTIWMSLLRKTAKKSTRLFDSKIGTKHGTKSVVVYDVNNRAQSTTKRKQSLLHTWVHVYLVVESNGFASYLIFFVFWILLLVCSSILQLFRSVLFSFFISHSLPIPSVGQFSLISSSPSFSLHCQNTHLFISFF